MKTQFRLRLSVLLLVSALLLIGNPLPRASHAHEPWNGAAGSTIYVDDSNQTGIEDGTQEHPYNTIQEGLGVALAGDTVRVAAGDYFENIPLKDGVKLQGAGPQSTRIDGQWSGSVVTAENVGPGTLLAGFTLQHGSGTGEGYTYGGGVYAINSTLGLRNCVVTENSANDGAGGLQGIDSNLTIENCTFIKNNGWWGGAITLAGGRAKILRSTFGETGFTYGGAIFIASGSETTLENNLITNTGLAVGIGQGGTANVTNNTIVDNTGNGIATDIYETGPGTGSATITNNILWGNNDDLVNLTATYSNIEDGDAGEGNISADPRFVDPSRADFRLRMASPCVDAGTNVGAPPEDAEGEIRPMDGNRDGINTVDIGADEFNPDRPLPLPAFLPVVFRPCAPLLWDDFADPNSGWPIVTESDFRLEYLDGRYRLWQDYKNGWLAATPGFSFADDYSLSVELQNATGVYGSYGLLFGLSGDWSEFYTFEVDPQGNYGIFLYNNENWTTLAEGFSPAISQGGSNNRLRIVRDGDLIEAWANEQLLASLSDSAYTGYRYVGLIASTYDDRNLDVRYDNFLVELLSCGAGARMPLANPPLTTNWERAGLEVNSVRNHK